MRSLESAAVHESGHAIAGVVLGAAPALVRLIPSECEFDRAALESVDVESRLTIFAAGRAAQRVILCEITPPGGAYPDYEQMAAATAGFSPSWGQQMRQEAHDQAAALITKHEQAVVKLANELLARSVLTAEDIRQIRL